MLIVENLGKRFPLNGRPHWLYRGLSFTVAPGERIGLIGRNGQGKSTLIKLVGGVLAPSEGQVRWTNGMTCSWPLGFGGGVGGFMTGIDNIRLISRLYDKPFKGLVDRVDEFAELGEALREPIKFYSSGMRARLAFGVSIALDFDCYLIDEVIAVGDASFTKRCQEELFDRRGHKAFIIASHSLDILEQQCDRALIIDNGRAKMFDDVAMAVEVYTALWEEHHNLDALRI